MARTFRDATDLLCLTAPQLSEIFGIPVQSVRQARMDPDSSGYRSPPDGWQAAIAKLARERAAELERLAEELRWAGE